jgi:CelD/BcsL family acetyltransferase involved in cellulose biosynthesis
LPAQPPTATDAILASVTSQTLEREPACPEAGRSPDPSGRPARRTLRVERRATAAIARSDWDAIAAATPWATPFSAWAFHRAWWDAYGANAHEETVVLVDADGPANGSAAPVAIVPLMHRHEVEAGDALTHTTMRHGTDPDLTRVAPDATAIFFGASYHADYATVLARPTDLPLVAEALVRDIAEERPGDWDVVDLRRLRCGDPAAEALADAFRSRERLEGWTVDLEREDVCPVVILPIGGTIDDYLATLGKKERHEIRRKVRRAEAVGEIRLEDATDVPADLETFIDLHQARWGADGLFPPTPGGDQSRVFFRRLFELFGPDGPLHLTFLTVAGRRIAAGVHLETADSDLFYNAGVDPAARELSPGVVMVYAYVERALAEGRRRLDFLRGDEPYKYEWGAVDEPIQRLLVRRRAR